MIIQFTVAVIRMNEYQVSVVPTIANL